MNESYRIFTQLVYLIIHWKDVCQKSLNVNGNIFVYVLFDRCLKLNISFMVILIQLRLSSLLTTIFLTISYLRNTFEIIFKTENQCFSNLIQRISLFFSCHIIHRTLLEMLNRTISHLLCLHVSVLYFIFIFKLLCV